MPGTRVPKFLSPSSRMGAPQIVCGVMHTYPHEGASRAERLYFVNAGSVARCASIVCRHNSAEGLAGRNGALYLSPATLTTGRYGMDGLHLIVHKVRGQAAIDVAQRVVIGDEDVWLIPTSGHRAYPLRWQPLPESLTESLSADAIEGSDWAALPDHYPDVEQGPSLVARLRSAVHLVGLSATAGLG